MSFGVGSWVLSLGFYGWCIKIVSILFICISATQLHMDFCFSMAIISHREFTRFVLLFRGAMISILLIYIDTGRFLQHNDERKYWP